MIDWGNMFFGDGDVVFLLEIVVRTAVLYSFALLMVRLMGKRGMAQLTPFEFVIIVALGSAVGDPMFYPDVPLVHGFVVIVTVVLAQRMLAFLTSRNEPLERALQGQPLVVVEKGQVLRHALEHEGFSQEELFEMLRLNGVAAIDHVERAVLEGAGRLSVLTSQDAAGGVDQRLWPTNHHRRPASPASE